MDEKVYTNVCLTLAMLQFLTVMNMNKRQGWMVSATLVMHLVCVSSLVCPFIEVLAISSKMDGMYRKMHFIFCFMHG